MLNQNPLIWQLPDWPFFKLTTPEADAALRDARLAQGKIIGMAAAIGFGQVADVTKEMFVQEVLATSAIEGETLNPASVRSSVLRKLGLDEVGGSSRRRDVDGLVDVIQDATSGEKELDEDRLFRWQSALFPGGTSGLRRIAVGKYRDHCDEMQIVSGPMGREVVHYTAPPSSHIKKEMDSFLNWFSETTPTKNSISQLDPIARAAIAHLWFESIHPFEDGNGRIGRAIVDMAIAQDFDSKERLYSLSNQLMTDRSSYYDALSDAQHGPIDVSKWVVWFAMAFKNSCLASSKMIEAAIQKSRFWSNHSQTPLNERQQKIIQRLLDDGDGGFVGGLNVRKYAAITGTSKPTATRDLADLVKNGLLVTSGQGKALRYFANVFGWNTGLENHPSEDICRPRMR